MLNHHRKKLLKKTKIKVFFYIFVCSYHVFGVWGLGKIMNGKYLPEQTSEKTIILSSFRWHFVSILRAKQDRFTICLKNLWNLFDLTINWSCFGINKVLVIQLWWLGWLAHQLSHSVDYCIQGCTKCGGTSPCQRS